MAGGMSDSTPTFAIVGAVNHGKSSVVSTLAENDQVRVSSMPGETRDCQRFWLLDLFVFYDTPGFQNALEALPLLAPAARAQEPLAVFRDFLAQQRGRAEFEAECLLLRPVVEGAGVVYVVDGSEPLLDIHAAEMEILRLTGQPRLAIINRTSTDDHVADWKRRLGLHFNAVREFNAHHATFTDRLELLETLAGIEQNWKPKLMRAVAIFREEWERRIGECAEMIVELLFDALTHEEVAASPEGKTRRAALGEELQQRFIKAVSAREARVQCEIIRLFGHHRVTADTASGPRFDAGLFSDETWRAFGLDEKQLLAAGTVTGAAAGAAVGAKVELGTGGGFLGAPTALGTGVGAGIGAVAAFLFGKQRPELKVRVPGLAQKFKVGGSALRVGPYAAVNFPWILIDRALGTFAYVVNRAHARRDDAVIDSAKMKTALDASGFSTAHWADAQRRECERLFTAIRKGKAGRVERDALRSVLAAQLGALSAAKIAAD
jgi:hypothetical protein